MGPEGNRGSILPLVQWIKDKLRNKKPADVTCQKCDGRGFHAPHPPPASSLVTFDHPIPT